MLQTISKETIVDARNRKEWRAWLQKNHETKSIAWLVLYHKASKLETVQIAEAVEEALCFGWIDSTKVKHDETSSLQSFMPRNPKSNWSKINKDRVKRLIKEGFMTEAGMKMVNLAKKKGTWTAMDAAEKLIIPTDLKKAFAENKKASTNFAAFPPSSKKLILGWILNAKLPATREKRIKEIVSQAAKNIRANHYVPKK